MILMSALDHSHRVCCRFVEFYGSLEEKQRAGHVDLEPAPGTVSHRSLYLIPASKDVAQLLQVSLQKPRHQLCFSHCIDTLGDCACLHGPPAADMGPVHI